MDNIFYIYGVMDEEKGKLISNITNPSHKFWQNKGACVNALSSYKSNRGRYDERKLKVVAIECKIIEEN